jgi:FkbM family methyltransferase
VNRLRTWERRFALAVARRSFPVLGVAHPAGVFVLPSDDATVLQKLFVAGSRSDLVVLERAVGVVGHERSVFVDVGANLGSTTLAALTLHGFSRAVAIEPDPVNARYLRALVAVNGLEESVTVVEAAIADREERMAFEARAQTSQGRRSGSGGFGGDGDLLVRATTLDALAGAGVYEPTEVGLLWMDAQGAEAMALRGATRLLDAGAPVVTAVRPKRLERLGELDAFRGIVTARFSTFVDLRVPNLRPGWSPQPRPIAELDAVVSAERSTDVLLLP